MSTPAPAARPEPPPRGRAGTALFLVLVGYLLLAAGCLLPLVRLRFVLPAGLGLVRGDGAPDEFTLHVHAHEFGQLANMVLAFGVMGGVFLWTVSPRGLVAAGLGVVAWVGLLPVQLFTTPAAHLTRPQMGAAWVGPEVGFGWVAWAALVLGGSCLAAAGTILGRGASRNQ